MRICFVASGDSRWPPPGTEGLGVREGFRPAQPTARLRGPAPPPPPTPNKGLHEALAQVMQTEAIPSWLDTPNPAFEGLKPLEVVERGQIDRLWRMLFHLEVGDAA